MITISSTWTTCHGHPTQGTDVSMSVYYPIVPEPDEVEYAPPYWESILDQFVQLITFQRFEKRKLLKLKGLTRRMMEHR